MTNKKTIEKTKKSLSTHDEFIQKLSPQELKSYKKGYKEFLMSELVLAAMQEDEASVRKLAKEAGLSPTVIQAIRSGKKKNFTIQTFLKILESLGYSIILEKGRGKKAERIELSSDILHMNINQ